MNIINLNSEFDLSKIHIEFAKSILGDYLFSTLIEEIPIFLLARSSMPVLEEWGEEWGGNPPTELLGFYQHSSKILGVDAPAIGLCPELIIRYAKSEFELTTLIAKVIVHEFAHALMASCPSFHHIPRDEFYSWMEESLANQITLEAFLYAERNKERNRKNRGRMTARIKNPMSHFDYVKIFISRQPANYRLGLELFEKNIDFWRFWMEHKANVQRKIQGRADWLSYVKTHYFNSDGEKLKSLFDELRRLLPR